MASSSSAIIGAASPEQRQPVTCHAGLDPARYSKAMPCLPVRLAEYHLKQTVDYNTITSRRWSAALSIIWVAHKFQVGGLGIVQEVGIHQLLPALPL